MSIYEQRAIQWCERYGIVEYKLRYNAGNNSTVKEI